MDFRVFITLLFCTFEVFCRRLSGRRTRTNQQNYYLPDIPKQFLNENYKIPSKLMCSDIRLKPADQYFLLPWWFHYCHRLQEARARTLRNSVFTNMPLYKKVLDRVKKFKQQVKDNPVEIPAYRDFDASPQHPHSDIYRPMARRNLHINRGRQFRFLEH